MKIAGAHPTDVRMTTRFLEGDVMEGITGAVHETGHALYEQGRSAAREGLPVSAAAGMAVHESQSLLWERMVALSPPFCAFLLPKLRAAFPSFGESKSAADLFAAVNAVKESSFVRVEADEVT
jgi:carboxypeptidase Taq